MQTFSTVRDAKEFLVNRILSQAQRDGVIVSEVERKMLYCSETAWTLPDMVEANQEFSSHYDQGEYERKIAGIVRNIQRAPNPDQGNARAWEQAVRALRGEDHYILVLIDSAGSVRPRNDLIKFVLTAVAIVSIFLAAIVFFAVSALYVRGCEQI